MNIRIARRKLDKMAPNRENWDRVHIKDVHFWANSTQREPFISASKTLKKLERSKAVTLIQCYWGKGGFDDQIKVTHV